MSQLRFDGKVAVVTGAGRGIGRAEAVFLAERGASVVVNDLGGSTTGDGQSAGPAEEVVTEITKKGGKAFANSSTIATPEGANEIVNLAVERFGSIDILVNNAGILDSDKFPDITPENLQRQLSVHTLGYFHVTRAAWPHMVKQNYGRIIMTVSSAGLYGMPTQLAYSTAKGGIIAMTRSLSLVAPETIKINAMAPGAYTRMVDTLKDENFRKFSETSRNPAAISPIVAVLAHESCPVSGEIFTAASGRVARSFMAETDGYFKLNHTPEDLAENWKAIVAEESYAIPGTAGENVKLTLDRLRKEGIEVPESLTLPEFTRSK